MPNPKAQEVKLSDAERQGLEKLVKRHQVGQQIALRARIVLAAADGLKKRNCGEICNHSGYHQTVAKSLGQVTRHVAGRLEPRRTFAKCSSSGSTGQDHSRPALPN